MAEVDRRPKDRDGDKPAGAASKRRWRLIPMAIALITVTAFAGGVWYAYDQGVKQGVRLKVPLIKAEPGPTKIVPEQPGGLQIPNQDKKIYDRIDQQAARPEVERLLPPPEAPKDIPAPIPPVETRPTMTAPEPETQINASGSGPGPVLPESGLSSSEPTQPKLALKGKTKSEPVAKQARTNPTPASSSRTPKAGAPGRYRVQLGAFRQPGQATAAWKTIVGKHRDLMSGLAPTVVRVDLGPGKGIYHRLQAGPVPDKAAAAALCGKLKARKQACLPVLPK